MRESDREALQISAAGWSMRASENTPPMGNMPTEELSMSLIGDQSWMDAATAAHGDGSSTQDVHVSEGIRTESLAPAPACDLTRATPLPAADHQHGNLPAEVRLGRIREKNRAAQARFRQKQKARTQQLQLQACSRAATLQRVEPTPLSMHGQIRSPAWHSYAKPWLLCSFAAMGETH